MGKGKKKKTSKASVEKKALKGKETTSTTPSVEQKRNSQLPEKSTSSSLDRVDRDVQGQEIEDWKGKKKISTSSVEQKKKPAFKFGNKEKREYVISEKPLSGKKLLLVEDTFTLRREATSLLTAFGATVDVCLNGEQAYEIVSKLLSDEEDLVGHFSGMHIPYDYILMDCEMPVMDGYEATKLIREDEKQYGGLRIPIIALTENNNAMREGELGRIKDAGMDFLVIKPLKIENLVFAITNLH